MPCLGVVRRDAWEEVARGSSEAWGAIESDWGISTAEVDNRSIVLVVALCISILSMASVVGGGFTGLVVAILSVEPFAFWRD